MITVDDLISVARTQKPYGIRGELMILFNREEYTEIDADYYFLMIEGIPVPFRVEEFAFSTETLVRVKFEDIENELDASRYVRLEVLLPRAQVMSEETITTPKWNFYIGYTVLDQHGETLGVIDEVDDTTINVLFIVRNDDVEHLIPATEDFITAVDEEEKILRMLIPEGLIDM